jgi:hypothetical protein
LRLAERLARKCPRNPRKFRNNCQNFRKPIPDTTLRANVYYSFPARLYTSTFAHATAARSQSKVPTGSELAAAILEIDASGRYENLA